MMSAYEWGLKHGSCQEAFEARRVFDESHPGEGQRGWWLACQRGDWLYWQLGRLPLELRIALLPVILTSLIVIVERAIRAHCLHCGVVEVERWAERWLSGENRREASAAEAAAKASSASAVWAALAAARLACAAEAEGAAWAEVAVRAVWAAWAAEGDSNAELVLHVDDIRRAIPEWPGGEE